MKKSLKSNIVNEATFGTRLAFLREKKGVSAREMSLRLGQNRNYVNSIECGRSMPSMTGFLCICDYFKITPMEFFDANYKDPTQFNNFCELYQQLTPVQMQCFHQLAFDLANYSNFDKEDDDFSYSQYH